MPVRRGLIAEFMRLIHPVTPFRTFVSIAWVWKQLMFLMIILFCPRFTFVWFSFGSSWPFFFLRITFLKDFSLIIIVFLEGFNSNCFFFLWPLSFHFLLLFNILIVFRICIHLLITFQCFRFPWTGLCNL